MSISAITSTSAASQLAYVSKTGSTTETRQSPPAHPPKEGGFISAIADALKTIGVSTTAESSDAAGTDSTSSTENSNAAQALGSFLEELMSALHAQSADDGAPPPYGEPPQGGPGAGGGPGKLAQDLQSLIAKLGDAGESSATESDSTSALETSFGTLLSALGADSSDAGAQLGSFLQALASSMPDARSSGNLINTTA